MKSALQEQLTNNFLFYYKKWCFIKNYLFLHKNILTMLLRKDSTTLCINIIINILIFLMPKLSYRIRTKSDYSSNSKGSSFLVTTILSMSFTLLSICYTLVWGLIFITTIERNSYPSNCKNLVDWGRGFTSFNCCLVSFT